MQNIERIQDHFRTTERLATLLYVMARDCMMKKRDIENIMGWEASLCDNNVRVAICEVRKLPGVKVKTHWGRGYRMEAETCALIKSVMGWDK